MSESTKAKETEIFISTQNLSDLKSGDKIIEILPELANSGLSPNGNGSFLSNKPPKPAVRSVKLAPIGAQLSPSRSSVSDTQKPPRPTSTPKSILKQPEAMKSKFKPVNFNNKVSAYEYNIDRSNCQIFNHSDISPISDLNMIDEIVKNLDRKIEEAEEMRIKGQSQAKQGKQSKQVSIGEVLHIETNITENDIMVPSIPILPILNKQIIKTKSDKKPSPPKRNYQNLKLTKDQINFLKDSEFVAENSLSKAVASNFLHLKILKEKHEMLNFYQRSIEEKEKEKDYGKLPKRPISIPNTQKMYQYNRVNTMKNNKQQLPILERRVSSILTTDPFVSNPKTLQKSDFKNTKASLYDNISSESVEGQLESRTVEVSIHYRYLLT